MVKINSEVSGSFRDLLLVLLRGERDEAAEGDPEAAEAQAEALHDTDGMSAVAWFGSIPHVRCMQCPRIRIPGQCSACAWYRIHASNIDHRFVRDEAPSDVNSFLV